MANSLIASDKGLQRVNDAREKLGWNRTDKRLLEAAEVSRATLNRFYAQQPIKHDNFVAICQAVEIKNWQRVAQKVLSSEQPQAQRETPVGAIHELPLLSLDRDLQAWFKALRYEMEAGYREETEEYFEWIIRIPVRSRFDRVLIHGVAGEVGMQNLARVEAIVKEKNLDEGCIVTDYRVSKSVAAYLQAEEEKGNHKIVCLTFDELIDRDVDFSPYIEWLLGEIGKLEIDRNYLELNCSKPEKDLRSGKYLPPNENDNGAEKIDDYMDDWLASVQKNHISVLGEFGTGKTWFAMHYAWVVIQAYRKAQQERKKRPRLPLFITLRDYAKASTLGHVIAGFFFFNHNIRLNGDVFDLLNQMGKLLIIFDGFDEMANKMDVQTIFNNFWALAEVITDNSKVILTCRNEHFPTTEANVNTFKGEKLASTQKIKTTDPRFEILNLHPFSIEQIRQVLTSRGANAETIDNILTNPELYDLVKRPLMVDLVLAALPEIRAGQKIDLARVYLYALKHKLERDIETDRTFTSMADKLFFLCEVSWAMLSQNELTLHYSRFPERLREVFGEAIEDKQLDHWHYDMMCQSILIRDHDGNYRPAHKSLLEFFVAYKFAAELGLLHPDFLALVRELEEGDLPVLLENPLQSPLGRGTLRDALEPETSTVAPLVRGLGDLDLSTQPETSAVAPFLRGLGDSGTSYKWSDYWRYCHDTRGKRTAIARFGREDIEKLVTTFGQSPLIPEVMRLLVSMLDLRVEYRQSNPLLELMQWTLGKTRQEAQWLGSNAGSALVKLNPYGLEYQDLSGAVLPNIDLVGAGLREANLSEANVTDALTTKTFSTCHAIATSEDGLYFFTGHNDGSVKIWSIDGQELFTCHGHQSFVISLAVSGEWLFSGSGDGKIKQWSIATGECQHTFIGHQDWITSLSVGGEWLFSGSEDQMIKQWSISTGKCQQTFTGHQDWVKSIAVSGEWLFSGSDDGEIKQWSIATGECQNTLIGHQNWITPLAVSWGYLFSGSDDRTIKQWKIATGEYQHTFIGHQDWVTSLVVSGEWLFSGSADNTIKQWSIATGECQQTFTGHQSSVISLAVSGKWLLSSSNDGTIKQWSIATGECQNTLIGHQDWVTSLAVSGEWLFSGSRGEIIKQWSIATGECQQTFTGHQDWVTSLAVSGEWLFSSSRSKIIKQWSIATGECQQTFAGHQDWVISLAVSGEWLFSGSGDNTIKQWSIATGECQQTFTGHKFSVTSLAVSEKWLFSGSDDRTIKQWSIATGHCQQSFTGHPFSVTSLAVSGEWLFSASDKKIKQWSIATGQCQYTLTVHQGHVKSLAVSGDWLFSGSDDGTIRQWKIATGECLRILTSHQFSIISLVVSREWLFSGSDDNTIKQWNMATGKCIATFNNSLCTGADITGVRGLTEAQIESLRALGAIDRNSPQQ